MPRLHTLVCGRPARYSETGTGPPVVFLHGWGVDDRAYEVALRGLAGGGVRVVAPALPGFGGTAPLDTDDRNFAGYAGWVAAFLDAVGVHDPAVVVGHSFGGGVAIALAHDHPATTKGLVLVNSVGGSAWSRHGSPIRSMADRPLWDWGLHLSRDLLPLRQLTHVLPVIVGEAIPSLLRDPVAFWRAAAIARAADLTVDLEELRCRRIPIVVLWGAQDRVVPRASADALAEAAGVECVTVPGGHGWMFAEPDRFSEVMTNVIASTALRSGGRLRRLSRRRPTAA